MNTLEYLDAVKAKTGLTTDYQLAKLLELEPSNITMYRKGRRVMDPYIATRVAEILEVPPMLVIAQSQLEREKDETKRAYWRKFAAAVTAAVAVNFFLPMAQKDALAQGVAAAEVTRTTDYGVFRRWLARLSAAVQAAWRLATTPASTRPA